MDSFEKQNSGRNFNGNGLRTFSAEELRKICLEGGADDAGFIEIGREAIAPERDDIFRIFPGTKTIISVLKRANRESIQSPSLPVVDWEFTKTYNGVSDAAGEIIGKLNARGIRGVAIPPGFPMDMTRWPGKVWEVSHKPFAVEGGIGHMGLHRIIIHPRFGNHIILDSLLIDATLDRYDNPLPENPCIECRLCVAVCPVGAINRDGAFNFMSCTMHNYHELFGGFQEWVEEIVSSGDIRTYRSKFRDNETGTKWQALTYGHAYRCSYCMAVCPAGEEPIGSYLPARRDYVQRHLKPLKTKEEPVYVIPGTRAEKVAQKNRSKYVRYVRNTIRPASIASFLDGVRLLFNPEKARGLNLNLHFEFTGKEKKTASISIADEKVHIQEGHSGKPDLHIRADSETWVGMLNGEISLLRAWLTGGLKMKGNPSYLKKFKECML